MKNWKNIPGKIDLNTSQTIFKRSLRRCIRFICGTDTTHEGTICRTQFPCKTSKSLRSFISKMLACWLVSWNINQCCCCYRILLLYIELYLWRWGSMIFICILWTSIYMEYNCETDKGAYEPVGFLTKLSYMILYLVSNNQNNHFYSLNVPSAYISSNVYDHLFCII